MAHYITGQMVPRVGLGTWKSTPQEAVATIEAAIQAGYRHIDTAFAYQNEAEIGDALQSCFQRGICRREDLFVTTKLWNSFHAPEKVLEGCQRSLQALKLDYVDLYLIHWPCAWKYHPTTPFPATIEWEKVSIQDTWRAMENLVDRGIVKAIGVSNFPVVMLHDMMSYARIKPAVNQIELHPYNAQTDLIRYCNSQQIHVTAYSPLGTPDNPTPPPNAPVLLQDPVLNAIGQKHHKSAAQVALRWAVQREGGSLSVIPKSTKPARIRENLDVYSWTLDQDDMQKIAQLDRHYRFCRPEFFFNVPFFA